MNYHKHCLMLMDMPGILKQRPKVACDNLPFWRLLCHQAEIILVTLDALFKTTRTDLYSNEKDLVQVSCPSITQCWRCSKHPLPGMAHLAAVIARWENGASMLPPACQT